MSLFIPLYIFEAKDWFSARFLYEPTILIVVRMSRIVLELREVSFVLEFKAFETLDIFLRC